MKIYSSMLKYYCPKCKTMLRKERNDLIFVIADMIKSKKQEFNENGEQILHCPNCQSIVAINSCGGISGYSRIITQESELLKMVMPAIQYLSDSQYIDCAQYNNDKKYSELLSLRFTNTEKENCNVFIRNTYGKIEMSLEDEEYEAFDMVKLVGKIIEILN